MTLSIEFLIVCYALQCYIVCMNNALHIPSPAFAEFMVMGVSAPSPRYFTRLIERETVRPAILQMRAMMAMIQTLEMAEAA